MSRPGELDYSGCVPEDPKEEDSEPAELPEPENRESPPEPSPKVYGKAEPVNWRRHARLWLLIVAVVSAFLFVIGNSEQVQIHVLLDDVWVPMYVALLIALTLGIVIGGAGIGYLIHRHNKRKAVGGLTAAQTRG